MTASARRIYCASLLILLLGAGVSILWGISLERGSRNGVMGFPGVYFGTRCLLQGGDPYDRQQMQRFYNAAGVVDSADSNAVSQSATLYVNLPTTSLIVAPLALLPFHVAQALWDGVIILSFLLAAYLMWRSARDDAPEMAVLLSFLLVANCEIIFSGGNTAGLVVALATIAAWCFLRSQFVAPGVVCLAVSLAIKPHDAGLIWLYFLVVGRPHRKRALQSAALTFALGLGAFFWVSHVAPRWAPELRSNLATISAPGGINEPGPRSIGVNSPDMIIDLQTVISFFRDSPQVYNTVTYAICSLLLLAWLFLVARSRFSPENAWIALAAISAVSMLVTYHRSYDAKLFVLLSIPASAVLWADGGLLAWIGLSVNTLVALLTGDIVLTGWTHFTRRIPASAGSFVENSRAAMAMRPIPFVLLAAALFYLFALWNRGRQSTPAAQT